MPSTHEECLEILEQLRWHGIPKCPYCNSQVSSPIKSEHRYHCRECFTSYSVTVGTIFHRTRLSLDKWFHLIYLILNPKTKGSLSIRKIANIVKTSPNTVLKTTQRINEFIQMDDDLMKSIYLYIEKNIEVYEYEN